MRWLTRPPAHRAVLLSGARQVGKTTLILQAVDSLLAAGVKPEQILYVTFDHPLLKLLGLDGVVECWREIQPPPSGIEYLLLDEIQFTNDWTTWLKHQTDFQKRRRIVVTGSALPINTKDQESGVGRWHTLKLATLSFLEYLQIKQIDVPKLPTVKSLADLFRWSSADRIRTGQAAIGLVGHFHEYLLRGGFPQTARVESIQTAQRLLREDIVDKVLKRDMTALFGVRHVLELERVFLYLCLHDGGILDVAALCSSLGLNRDTVNRFLGLLEATHLIYILPRFGKGKEVLKAKDKVFLADAAISGSVMLRGKSLIDDAARLGATVETAFFKHVFSHYYQDTIRFSYWQDRTGSEEVDIIAETGGKLIPFEVKYSNQPVAPGDLRGLRKFCAQRNVTRGYVITRDVSDFDTLDLGRLGDSDENQTWILKVPAVLACYWLSYIERDQAGLKDS